MARRIANFSYDRRGCEKLLLHVTGLLESGSLDKDIVELNLNGTRASSWENRRHFQKIVAAFAQVRTILLNGCCLQNVDFLAQLLCSKFFACKRVDLTGNFLSKYQVESFIASLEGRSYKKCVAPFWLAIGTGMDELLTTGRMSCDPFSANGCRCHSKRVVHVIVSFSKPASLPPPPEEAPPSPLRAPPDLIVFAQTLASAREQLREALEKERGRSIIVDGATYVLAVCQARYFLVDFCSADNGFVEALGGERLPLDKVQPVQSETPFLARAERFNASSCGTEGSYLDTEGGEAIQFILHSSGWVAAALEGQSDWKWFPLNRCLR